MPGRSAWMQLFHVGDGVIEPGQILRRYAFAEKRQGVIDLIRRANEGDRGARTRLLTSAGCLRRRFRLDPSTQLAFVEVVFERARARLAPTFPSRFDSVFLWPTPEL